MAIYLDSNSYSVPLPDVIKEVNKLMEIPLNPSSTHFLGQKAHGIIESARDEVKAHFANNKNYEVIFTSSCSEANNMVIKCINTNIESYLCSSTEHKSILSAMPAQKLLARVTNESIVDIDHLLEILKNSGKTLLSIIHANNETGAINNLAKIIQKARAVNNNLIIHSDIAQSAGKIPINIAETDLDIATLAGYKFGGIIGCGAIIFKKNLKFMPLIDGGGQENKMRAGTENVLAIHALKTAINCTNYEQYSKISKLRDYLEENLYALCDSNLIIFAKNTPRISNTSYFAIKNLQSKIVSIALNQAKIYVGTGSACSAGIDEESHVLSAMGVPQDISNCAIRVSLGCLTTKDEIDIFLNKLTGLYKKFNITSLGEG